MRGEGGESIEVENCLIQIEGSQGRIDNGVGLPGFGGADANPLNHRHSEGRRDVQGSFPC